MTKSELKTGMITRHRNGDYGLVVKDNCYGEDAILFSSNNWTGLEEFDEETLEWRLNAKNRTEYAKTVDIVEVFLPNLPCDMLNHDMKKPTAGFSGFRSIWKREDVVEMTLEEICKTLGKNIKLVRSKN